MQPSGQPPGAITLFVEDLAAAREFYQRCFDLPVVFEDADSVVFRLGATLLNLLLANAAHEVVSPAPVGDAGTGVRAMITLDVPDVDAAAEQLAERGVPLLNGPLDRPWGVRTLALRDPAGHVWELAAPLPR